MECFTEPSAASGAFVLVFGLLMMWLGDYLGRKFPTQWSALRAGLKVGGSKLRDAFKDE